MATYEIGVRTTNITIANATVEFRAVRKCTILEVMLSQVTGTASSYGFGRPANTPAGGTINLGQATDRSAVTTSGLVISGQSTAPTAPTNFMRRLVTPAAVGSGIIWTWPERDLVLDAVSSLVFWNITASVACDIYVRFDD